MKQQVPDRKRLRREYLKMKALGFSQAATARILHRAANGGGAAFGAILMSSLLILVLELIMSKPVGSWNYPPGMIAFCAVGCIVSLLMYRFAQALQIRAAKLAQLPYVPPVTPNTLPADEILVRSTSELPTVQSAVLLRMASGIETPREELLRPGNRTGTG